MSHYHEAAIQEEKNTLAMHIQEFFTRENLRTLENDQIKKVVGILNQAFKADPKAIDQLLHTSVPCGLGLAVMDHIVNEDERGRSFKLTALGLLNGILGPLLGSIVVVITDEHQRMYGFGYQKSYADE